MDLALISDSHIPSRAQRLPDEFRERIAGTDHVLHTGDFDSKGALADIRDLAPALSAVSGNTDPQVGLPAVATVELGGVEFVLTHGTGPKRGYRERVAQTVQEHASGAAVGVAGHTHEALDATHDGVRILNPGSVTGAAPASRTTMMTATVSAGRLSVELHEHDSRP
jgi:putative phosphoesterase